MRYISKPPFSFITLLVGWSILTGCLGVSCLVATRSEDPLFLVMLGAMLWAAGIVISTVAHTSAWLLARWTKTSPRFYRLWQIGMLIVPVLLGVVFIGSAAYISNDRQLFESYVISPMPQSVRVTRAAGTHALQVDEVVIDFQIAPEDVDPLLSAGKYGLMGSTIPNEVYRAANEHLHNDLKSIGPVTVYQVAPVTGAVRYEYRYLLVTQDRRRMVYFCIAGH